MKTIKPIIEKEKKMTRKEKHEIAQAARVAIAKSLNLEPVILPSTMQQFVDKLGINDFDAIGETKDLALRLLIDRASGEVWGRILGRYGCRWDMYNTARFSSVAYKRLSDAIETAVKDMRIARVEDNLFTMAMGEVPVDKKHIAPDVKAADLYLKGNDSRYRDDKEQQATQVVINLGGSLKDKAF